MTHQGRVGQGGGLEWEKRKGRVVHISACSMQHEGTMRARDGGPAGHGGHAWLERESVCVSGRMGGW